MNEFLRNFIMNGIRDMIRNKVALYQTYQYASGWFSKGVLLQEDLEEIEELYKQLEVKEEITEEEPIEEVEETEKVGEIEPTEETEEE